MNSQNYRHCFAERITLIHEMPTYDVTMVCGVL